MLTQKSIQNPLKKLKTSKELVEEFVAYKPAPEHAKILEKPSTLMNEGELKLENSHLTEKLKQYNIYCDRLIKK